MASAIFSLSTPEAVARIREANPTINAYLSTRLEDALRDAEARAEQPARSPLHGVPYGLKDEWETLALPTTAGSFRHRQRRSTENSAVFEAFDQAGAVLVGKTNLSDLGLAPESTNFVIGPTRNPWDSNRTAGGSSGGAAAAVAAGMQGFDWGTDIGGSIRQPAAFCGILGMRLSSEIWPITGSFPVIPAPVRWMCGQGPLCRTTAEMRAVLDVAAPTLRAGSSRPFEPRRAVLHMPEDLGGWPNFANDVRPHLEAAIGGELRSDHGLPSTFWIRSIYSAVWASQIERLVEADPTLPFVEGMKAAFSSLAFGERRGDKRLHPHAAELLVLMSLGRVTVFSNRERALAKAEGIADRMRQLWDDGAIVVAPVATLPASPHGKGNEEHAEVLRCTAAGNLADATALSIPFGRFGTMPRALQLMGPPGSEHALLDVADRLIASRDGDPTLAPSPWPDRAEPRAMH
jgi:Asp-tRNA(Asn)/Glu-tRNA(Gln) amidotransferase A subunit family amidase